ncbi:MAG: hypothetical protein KJN97_04355, partial [Deltaproteobacteria bacterium]|nr:hypothetical protein [Deltaproteobacteria bacterium]
CFERILPPRKDTTISFRIDGEPEPTLSAMATAVVREVAQGKMTPVEGTAAMKLLEARSRICELDELTTRINSIEARVFSERDQ